MVEKLFAMLFDIKRVPTKLILALWISCGVVLFVPEETISRLNLSQFIKEYGKYLGVIFIVTTSLLVVTIISSISSVISERRRNKRIENSILAELNSLGYHEKAILREFFLQNKSTLKLPFDDETVVGLANKRIIYQASSTGFTYIDGPYFPYSITEFALNNMTLEQLELPRQPTDTEKQILYQKRPDWAKR